MCTSSWGRNTNQKQPTTAAKCCVTLYDVVAELVGSALPRLENYAAQCTRTPAKGKAGGSVKILLTRISNFYDSDSLTLSAVAALLFRARTINHPSPAIK